MDFDQLTTFIEVATQGNFSRAGEKVLRSQPAVSAQIRQLENEYGERLFDRTKKSVRLTPAGELLFDYAQRLLALRNESLRAIADQGSVTRGVLSIGANETTFLYVLPEILAQYRKQFPRVRTSIYRNFSQKVLEKIEDGALELGVVTLPIKVPSLKVIRLFRDPLIWIAAPDNPLVGQKKVTLSDIAEHELIMHKVGSLRRLMDAQMRPYKPRLKVTMELTSAAVVKKFVALGFGVSLISASFVQEEVKAGKLKVLPVDESQDWRELGLVYHRDRSLSQAAKSFLEVARKNVAKTQAAIEEATKNGVSV